MATINLIPPKIKAAKRNKKIFSQIYFALVILIAMAAISYGALFALDYFANQELSKTKLALAQEKAKLKNLEPIEKDVQAINSKLQKISTLKKDRVLWSLVLIDINHSTPQQLKVDSFAAGTKDNKVTFTGAAETRRDIVEFQTKLNTSNFYNNFTFDSSSYSESESMYTFTMNGVLKPQANQ